MADAEAPRTDPGGASHAERIVRLAEGLVRELYGGSQAAPRVTVEARLGRDLGLDSLGRTELVARVERELGRSLPEAAIEAETIADLARAAASATGGGAGVPEVRHEAPVAAEGAPERAQTLPQVLAWHLRAHPDRTHITLYEDPEHSRDLSYAELEREARAVAAGLRHRGIAPGQSVAIMLPTSADYFFGFFGVLLAGGVPVPIYPPARPSQLEEHLRRHARILDNARAAVLVTVPEAKLVAQLMRARVPSLGHVAGAQELRRQAREEPIPEAQPGDTALLQYTSGSTGDPKGVVLSHRNLLANVRAMGQRVDARSTDCFVSWLPLYHDMGLIGAWLGSLYFAMPLVVMSPLAFLARPERWLWAIHRHRGTLSAAPNFAYELCLRNVRDAAIQGVDLSSWRLAFNGAEPVSCETLRRFGARFADYGLAPETLAPVYGLAESSVGLVLPAPGRRPVLDRIRRKPFATGGRAEPAEAPETDVIEVPGCGAPLAGHEVRVVDEDGRELPDRREGRLQFRGPSATTGYLRNPEATRALFDGDWLDTGDRGYTDKAEVFVSGRVKDLIIRGGRNIYPYELEEAVGGIEGVRKGCVAAFASRGETMGSERLVVIAETRETRTEALDRLRREIVARAVDLITMPPDDVVLARPHTVLKTSSGKIRRAAMRDAYEKGKVGGGARAVWWQLVRSSAAALVPQLRRMLHRADELAYAAYCWGLFWAAAPLVWTAVAVLPRPGWRWAVSRWALRAIRRLSGTRLGIEGLENLPPEPCVVVANHSSYLDALTLIAALPRDLGFIAKRELAARFSVRVLLKGLGTLFVERFDTARSSREADHVVEALRSGRSLAFFPEGTLTRAPGLLPFRMGAFVCAARAGVPVVPVVIRGTRTKLRDGTWFPRRGPLWVVVGRPVRPLSADWQGAIGLRDEARQAILRHSGEPDLQDPADSPFNRP